MAHPTASAFQRSRDAVMALCHPYIQGIQPLVLSNGLETEQVAGDGPCNRT